MTKSIMNSSIAIIGGGAFGTAIACVLSRGNEKINLFVRDEIQADSINQKRKNTKYLPDFKLPKKLKATVDINSCNEADIIFLAVPTKALESTCIALKSIIKSDAIIVNLSKGLHTDHFTLDRLVSHHLPENVFCSLKGPTFARPLMFGAPAGMTLGCHDPNVIAQVKSIFRTGPVSIEEWSNPTEIEFISAIKNVLAIIVGICDATEDNPNTRFLVVNKIFREANLLLKAFRFETQTLFTYAGCGDLLMTALNDSSRNRTLGLLIGRGFDFRSSSSGPLMEGHRTLQLILKHLETINSKHSLLIDLDRVLKEELSPQEFFQLITQPNRNYRHAA